MTKTAFLCLCILIGSYFSFAQNTGNVEIDKLLEKSKTFISGQSSKANQLLEDALALAKINGSEKLVQQTKVEVSKIYLKTGKQSQVPDLLYPLLSKAKLQAKDRGHILVTLGMANVLLFKYDSAIVQLESGLKMLDSNDFFTRMISLEQLGTAYHSIGNQPLAFKSFAAALDYAEISKSAAMMALINMKIGELFLSEREFEKANDYFLNALISYNKLQDEFGAAKSRNSLGRLRMLEGELDSSEYYFNQALAYFKKQDQLGETAKAIDNLGLVALKRKKRESAIQLFEKALKIRKEQKIVTDISQSYYNLSKAYLSGKRYNQALANSRKGLGRAVEDKSGPQRLNFTNQLYQIFKELNYGDSALVYLERFIVLQDSMNGLANDKLAIRLKTEFEDKQRKKELQRLREVNLANKKVIKNQRMLSVAIGIISILSLAMVFVMYNRYRLKTKVAKVIAAKNKENVILLKELHHRVKNNLQFIASMISIQRSKIKDKSTRQELQESLQKVSAMAMVHNKLYRKTASSAKLSFKDFLAELTDSLALSYGHDTEQIRVRYGWKNPHFDIDTYNALGLIINEMVTNTFKHCDEETVQIDILFKRDSTGKRIIYRDNGPGIEGELTLDQQNTGTVLIRLLAEEMGGHLEFVPNTENEKGIKIVLDLKNNNHGKPTDTSS